MSKGQLDFVNIPIIYEQRYIPTGRKKATIGLFKEEVVIRVPSWDLDESVEICKIVKDEEINNVVYRVARCLDNTVKFMAPCLSDALSYSYYRTNGNNRSLERCPIFYYHCDNYNAPLLNPRDNLGTVLSSNRLDALKMVDKFTNNLVLINNQLFAPCGEPGWSVNKDQTYDVLTQTYSYNKINRIWPQVDCFYTTGGNSTELLQDENNYKYISSNYPRTQFPIEQSGTIEINIPGILSNDREWFKLRMLLKTVLFTDDKTQAQFLPNEIALKNNLKAILKEWPTNREAYIIRGTEKMARIVHGINPTNRADILKQVIDQVKTLNSTATPLNLAQRLVKAKIKLPELPLAKNADLKINFEQQDDQDNEIGPYKFV